MDHFFPFIDLLTIACQHHLMDTWFMHFSEVPAKYWFRSCVCPALRCLPTGGKYWRMKYFFGGKEKRLALGVYPHITLAEARERRAEAKKLLAKGTDPGEAKKEAKRTATLKAANTFEAVAREWFEKRKHKWAPHFAEMVLDRLERLILPELGKRAIADIAPPEVLAMLRLTEGKGALELARRLMQMCAQIFMYAIATGRAARNPVSDLRGALKTPVVKHRAYLKESELPDYFRKLAHTMVIRKPNWPCASCCLPSSAPLSFAAQWTEIDWDKAEWRIPAERMKMKEQHLVPLSTQAIAVLRELQHHSGTRQYIFVNQHNPHAFMSENTMLYALYRMGYHSRTTGHGFRSTASTILNEHGFRADVIERQLAHTERNNVRAAYNHAQYLPERRKMMQWWADYIESIGKTGKE